MTSNIAPLLAAAVLCSISTGCALTEGTIDLESSLLPDSLPEVRGVTVALLFDSWFDHDSIAALDAVAELPEKPVDYRVTALKKGAGHFSSTRKHFGRSSRRRSKGMVATTTFMAFLPPAISTPIWATETMTSS